MKQISRCLAAMALAVDRRVCPAVSGQADHPGLSPPGGSTDIHLRKC
jgi:hypothetical protein